MSKTPSTDPRSPGADIPVHEHRHASRGTEDPGFIKALGSVDALFIGFGAMIGFGWIVLTGGWLESAGTLGALIAFAAGGVIMGFVGVVYSEMVAAMPHAGGEHNYLMRGMGPRLAMIGSWGITGGYIGVVMFEAVAVPRTVAYLFPNIEHIKLWSVAGFDVHLTWALIGTVTAIALTWLNIRGIKMTSIVQTFVVSFLIIVAVFLVLGAFVGGDIRNSEPLFHGGVGGFMVVLGVVPFLFVGFDVIPQSAEEMRIAPRQIGKLVVFSVGMAVLFYLIVIFTTSLALPADELVGFDLVTADAMAKMFGGQIFGQIVIAGGLAGIITSWIAFLIGASRLMWAMARSGMLPAWFGVLHPKYRTPVNALLFIGVLSAAAPFLGTAMLGWAVDAGSPMIVLTYCLVAITFLILRRREPDMERPMRVGGAGSGGIVIGVIAVILTAVLFIMYIPKLTPLSVTLDWQSYLMFGIWMIIGIVLMLRLPAGIKPGEHAEVELLDRIAAKRGKPDGPAWD